MALEANYSSGDDYEIEFLEHRFAFNALDFQERVTAAAVKLGLIAPNELDEEETGDLVELVERSSIEEPRSGLFGRLRSEARVRARVKPKAPRPKDERRRGRARNGESAPRPPKPSWAGRERLALVLGALAVVAGVLWL